MFYLIAATGYLFALLMVLFCGYQHRVIGELNDELYLRNRLRVDE